MSYKPWEDQSPSSNTNINVNLFEPEPKSKQFPEGYSAWNKGLNLRRKNRNIDIKDDYIPGTARYEREKKQPPKPKFRWSTDYIKPVYETLDNIAKQLEIQNKMLEEVLKIIKWGDSKV